MPICNVGFPAGLEPMEDNLDNQLIITVVVSHKNEHCLSG